MTPERIAEIAESAWLEMTYEPVESELAMRRAIRQAVNEAMEQAATHIDVPFTRKGNEFADAIRALKIPEAP